MIERTRRQFLSDLLKAAIVTAPALLSTDTARGEALSIPKALPHYLSLGFTYGGDECRFLNNTFNPHPKVSADTLINFSQTAENILGEDCSDCEWDFVRGAAPLDHDPETNLRDLEPLYKAAASKGMGIIQAIGKDQPFYPPERLPNDVNKRDPDYLKKYADLVYGFRKMMDENGLTPYVCAWQLGNESLNRFGGNNPASTLEDMRNLKATVSDTGKPTVINNFFSFDGPGISWKETQEVADIAALDFYLQAENNRGTITGLRTSLLKYLAESQLPVIGLEEQTRRWKTNRWTFKNFTSTDFLRIFYATAPLLPVIGLWEVDKVYCLAKRGRDIETFKAIVQAMRQTKSWNGPLDNNKELPLPLLFKHLN